jgi:retron-type reverse transcriptase
MTVLTITAPCVSQIDGLTVAGFEQRQGELLERLHKQLREKTYRPSPVKRVAIPKLGGGTRNLGIPSVRDQVVQQGNGRFSGHQFRL